MKSTWGLTDALATTAIATAAFATADSGGNDATRRKIAPEADKFPNENIVPAGSSKTRGVSFATADDSVSFSPFTREMIDQVTLDTAIALHLEDEGSEEFRIIKAAHIASKKCLKSGILQPLENLAGTNILVDAILHEFHGLGGSPNVTATDKLLRRTGATPVPPLRRDGGLKEASNIQRLATPAPETPGPKTRESVDTPVVKIKSVDTPNANPPHDDDDSVVEVVDVKGAVSAVCMC